MYLIGFPLTYILIDLCCTVNMLSFNHGCLFPFLTHKFSGSTYFSSHVLVTNGLSRHIMLETVVKFCVVGKNRPRLARNVRKLENDFIEEPETVHHIIFCTLSKYMT